MRLLPLLAVVLVGAIGLSAAHGQDHIAWQNSVDEASQMAQREHRLVLLHFWSESCPPCLRLEKSVFKRREFVRALHANYVPVKVNVTEQRELARRFGIKSIPTDVILTPEGREVHRAISPGDLTRYIGSLDQVAAHTRLAMIPSQEQPRREDSTPVVMDSATRPPMPASIRPPVAEQHPLDRSVDSSRRTVPPQSTRHAPRLEIAGPPLQTPQNQQPNNVPSYDAPGRAMGEFFQTTPQSITNPYLSSERRNAPALSAHKNSLPTATPGLQPMPRESITAPPPNSLPLSRYSAASPVEVPAEPTFVRESSPSPKQNSAANASRSTNSAELPPPLDRAQRTSPPVFDAERASPTTPKPIHAPPPSTNPPQQLRQPPAALPFDVKPPETAPSACRQTGLANGAFQSNQPQGNQPQGNQPVLHAPVHRPSQPQIPQMTDAPPMKAQSATSVQPPTPIVVGPQQPIVKSVAPPPPQKFNQQGVPFAAASDAAHERPQLLLDGFCPVTLVDENRWQPGNVHFNVVHEHGIFWFAGPDHVQRFLARPAYYAPALSGHDVVRWKETGQMVLGKRAHGIAFRQRYYLFSDEETLQRFWQAPERYVEGL